MQSREPSVSRWLAAGERVVAATLVSTSGSTSHDPGATFYVSESGAVAGAVSGGCVESALFTEAERVFRAGAAHLVSYGPADESPFGLTCGGTIDVLVAPVDAGVADAVTRARDDGEPIAVVSRLKPPFEQLVVTRTQTAGGFSNEGLELSAREEARTLLDAGETTIRSFGPDGEPIGDEERCFFHVFADPPVMYVVGAVDFTRPLVSAARLLGYRVVVIDPRDVFATPERIPDADEIVLAWPDEVLAQRKIDRRSALVVLTHDEKFDIPVLSQAVRTDVGYIGVMGSRRTHARRVELLREAGLSDDDLARINAPIGLDIGARTPEQTAISIVAEIVAERNGRDGGRLREGRGNLRGRPLVGSTAP